MQFTFGIVTDGKDNGRTNKVISSIQQLGIPEDKYEILIVGDYTNESVPWANQPIILPFTHDRWGWITKKKNLLCQQAKFDNVVLLHDYVAFDKDWYKGWVQFGNNWDVAMNVILDINGNRFRDWCAWDDERYGHAWVCTEPWCGNGVIFNGKPCVVPYEYKRTNKMYISGTYFVVKKQLMLDEPLNEKLYWGQGEDVEWSIRIRDTKTYLMNQASKNYLLKEKDRILPLIHF